VVPNKADSENDVILEMHHVGNYEEFSCIDSSLQYYNENEDCGEAINEKIAVKQQKTPKEEVTGEDDTKKCEQAYNQDARKFIAALQLHFLQEGTRNLR
jgi:hypothetical protein